TAEHLSQSGQLQRVELALTKFDASNRGTMQAQPGAKLTLGETGTLPGGRHLRSHRGPGCQMPARLRPGNAVGPGGRHPGATDRTGTAHAQRLGVHAVLGRYQRGTMRNAVALIGPSGEVLGTYHKTHLFCGIGRTDGGCVTPTSPP